MWLGWVCVLWCGLPDLRLHETPVFRDEELFDARRVAVGDGGVAVLTRRAPFVHVTGTDGAQPAHWGVSGQAPGELAYPGDVALVGAEVWVLERVPPRIHVYTRTGAILRTVLLDEAVYPSRFAVAGGRVFVQDGDLYRPENILYERLEDGRLREIRGIHLASIDLNGGRGPAFTAPACYGPSDLWCALPDGRLVVFPGSEDRLVVHQPGDGGWIVGASWSLGDRRFPIGDAAFDRWLDRVAPPHAKGGFVPVAWLRKAAENHGRPDRFPAALELWADGEIVWVLRAYRPTDQLWQAFRDGRQVHTLTLPASMTVHGIRSGRVYLNEAGDDAAFAVYNIEGLAPGDALNP